MTKSAESGENDRVALFVYFVLGARADLAGKSRLDIFFVQSEEEGRDDHGERHRRDQNIPYVLIEHIVLGGERNQDKREFTPFGESKRERKILTVFETRNFPDCEENDELDEQQPGNECEDQKRLFFDQRYIDT